MLHMHDGPAVLSRLFTTSAYCVQPFPPFHPHYIQACLNTMYPPPVNKL